MRKDMKNVLVERPRLGHSLKNFETKVSRQSVKNMVKAFVDEMEDPEDLDLSDVEECNNAFFTKGERQTIKPKVGSRKSLNENLRPLRRFLRSKLGKNWDVIYSEIAANVNRDSAVQQHIIDHLKWEVSIPNVTSNFYLLETSCGILPYYINGRNDKAYKALGFYVDNNNILREVTKKTKYPSDIIQSHQNDIYPAYSKIQDSEFFKHCAFYFVKDNKNEWWFVRVKDIPNDVGTEYSVPKKDLEKLNGSFNYAILNSYISDYAVPKPPSVGIIRTPIAMWKASKIEISNTLPFIKKFSEEELKKIMERKVSPYNSVTIV